MPHSSLPITFVLRAAAILLPLAAVACTPSLDHLEVNPELDHQALQAGGVAVLPAASWVADLSPTTGQYLLLENIERWRGKIPAVTAHDDAFVDEVLDAVVDRRPLPHRSLATLEEETGSRFLAVVMLHSYTTHYTEEYDTYVDSDGYQHTDTTLTSEASLDGEVALVDTVSAEVWWRGAHLEHADNRVSYTEREDDWSLFLPGYPEPPTAFELSDDLLEAMVRNWPRPD